jgi:hypothetical protein
VRRRHASHITVVLSKAAHSGPSVCLRARAPCPLRVSCPGTDRAERAAQAAGVSVQPSCRRERAVQTAGSCASVPPLVKTGSSPCVQLTHGPGRTVALPYFVPRQCTLLCGPYRSLCLYAKYCGVSRHFSADCTDTFVFVHEALWCFTACTTGLLC